MDVPLHRIPAQALGKRDWHRVHGLYDARGRFIVSGAGSDAEGISELQDLALGETWSAPEGLTDRNSALIEIDVRDSRYGGALFVSERIDEGLHVAHLMLRRTTLPQGV